jgi:hypothetical protein
MRSLESLANEMNLDTAANHSVPSKQHSALSARRDSAAMNDRAVASQARIIDESSAPVAFSA